MKQVEPKDKVNIEIDIEAPNKIGNYISNWKLGYLDGEFVKFFGSKINFDIKVEEDVIVSENKW